jgi:hypothetical protein
VAVKIGLFTVLGKGGMTAAQIRARCPISPMHWWR